MKRILLVLVVVTAISSCNWKSSEDGFVIEKGVNIAHWLSQSEARGEERAQYFTEADVAQIAEWGFDHIRIPVDEVHMFHEDGTKDMEAFALLHNILGLCEKYSLRAIVDLHILRSHYFIDDYKPLFHDRSAQEAFYECWRKISGELKDYSTSMVAYELMNEPVADNHEDWNMIVNECYNVVRELEKERVILIGSNRWQDVHTADQLALPADDPYIILSFHYYEPNILTHYQASWTEFKNYAGTVTYPGRSITKAELASLPDADQKLLERWAVETYDKERLARDFSLAANVAKNHGIQVYCGEYGCLSHEINDEMRYRWLTDMNDAFDELGIARAVWCYREGKDGFGILSGPEDHVDRLMLDSLLK